MGENRSQTISEGGLLKLTAADRGRILNDGSGLSGKVHVGSKGISVHFRYRYRFGGESREMALGAWPRAAFDAIRANFEETKLRVERGGDPAGQKQAAVKKMQIEQAQLEQQQRELAERQRETAEQQLVLKAMFEAWHPEAMAENTLRGAQAVRRIFELHLLPQAGDVRVSDLKPEHVRKAVKALIETGKVPTAISLYSYTNAMFLWAGRRRPWRLLFEVNPAEEVDLDRLLQLAQTQTSKLTTTTKNCTSLRAVADAKLVGKAANLYRVPIELIRFRENFNPRNYEDEANQERIRSFEESYRAQCYVPPPELEWENGFAYPVEGHRRVLGAQRAGMKDLLGLEWKGTPFERRARLAKAAKDTTLKPLESARNIAQMKAENPEKSNADIAAEIAVSVQAVEQALVLDRAPDALKAMIEANQIEAQAAIALVRQHGEKAAQVARQLYARIKAELDARATLDARINAAFHEPAANDAVPVKPASAKHAGATKSNESVGSNKSVGQKKPAKPAKPKAPKVTVRAMRELKARDATASMTLPPLQLREVAEGINAFALAIDGDVLAAEVNDAGAVNDGRYTLEVDTRYVRALMKAWMLLRPLVANAA